MQWEVSTLTSLRINCYSFFSGFQNIFEESFPKKFFCVKPQQKKVWVTQGIKISSAKKRELSRLAKQTDDLEFLEYVKKYKRIFKSVCNKAKELCNTKFIKEADNMSKAAWSVVKNELGVKKRNNDFVDIEVLGKCISSGR